MDYRKRLLEITTFLKPYQRIWQNEIMLLYPDPLQYHPMDWVEELAGIRNKHDIIQLEKKEGRGLIHNPELLAFYQRIEELCQMPSIPDLPPMPFDFKTFLYMTPKKQYEIKRLAPLINAKYQQHVIANIVDIGGGIGLLAQTLNNQYRLKVTTLDMDPVLQKTGSTRYDEFAKDPDNKVQYHQVKVSPSELKFNSLLTPDSMTIGLHTCGELANAQLQASAKAGLKSIINFGCCYQLLEDTSAQNISTFAQSMKDAIFMKHFALTLAARAHRKMDEKDFDLKMKVKLYRYSIHIMLHEVYGIKELVSLGNSSPKLYDESFGHYATEQLRRINLTPKPIEQIEKFYQDPKLQDLIWKMIAAGLIRNALGRVLELYLLLDRTIFLEEQGYQVELMEFFDEATSPRNLGIVATKN